MNQETLKRIADEWTRLPHNPQGESWTPFTLQVIEQFHRMPIKIAPTEENPYNTSAEMFRDVERGVLKVWTGGSTLEPQHPLGVLGIGQGMRLNTAFRAVHDYYGHCLPRNPFETIEGELAAYKAHRAMFPPEAIPALFGETVGQLAYFSAFGDYVPTQKAVEFGPEFLALVD